MNKPMYIQMFSIHGLVRYENMELGRDADTGGQVKYVVELAEELSRREDVRRIDLFTRLISDKRVSEDYAEPVTQINDKFRIVRIQCGGKKYMRKELLWPHLDEFIDKTVKFVKREGVDPDIIHGHYADAGYVGMALAEFFGTPFVYTGHSLGRPKKQKLLHEGMKERDIDKKYHIEHRIAAEEEAIKNADLIITSTRQEVDKQYGMYDNKSLPVYSVIPPGVNLDKFFSFYHYSMPEMNLEEEIVQAHSSVLEEMDRFFMNPEKPLILALCRADKRKNISGLIEAFGRDRGLQAMANLAIFAGIRKDISSMERNEKDVLTEMLLLMDKYDLYGKMAIPKKHDFTYEVPELYRIAAEKKGVFVNVAFTEPFGLTLIEASACGLPIVATNDGGPRDIIDNCNNGVLADPNDPEAVSAAVRAIITDPEKWKEYSSAGIKGVRDHYSWASHAGRYLKNIRKFSKDQGIAAATRSGGAVGKRLVKLKRLLITDIDNTLIGDPSALEDFIRLLKRHKDDFGFGAATGRTVASAQDVLKRYDVPAPDIFVTSVGAEIYYRNVSLPDKGWQTHISKKWEREKIKSLLDQFDYLTYQEEDTQREFKVSYYMTPGKDRLAEIHDALIRNRFHYTLIYSHDEFLDILPHRASKGKAIRYISYKWEIPLNKIVVCGDSGNDAEMLVGATRGVVVANHARELDALKGKRGVYFSKASYAAGIVDGLKKYGFIEKETP